MKRYLTSHWSMAAIAATVALFSCNKDEDPVVPVASFQQATRTVDESAGTIDVPIQLDVAAPDNIQIGYTLTGTATEGTSSSSDYQVLGIYGTVSIAKGSTSGTVQLQIKQDEAVEADETIIITLSASSTATLGAIPSTTITLQSDDLGSKVGFTTTATTVDETAGTIDILLTLDKPAGQDLTVDYTFNYELDVATALDSVTGFNEHIPRRYYDFYVVGGTFGKLTIPAGSTTAKAQLHIYSDINFEDNEVIEMNLNAVSAGGQLGSNTKHTVTVNQEDGRAIALLWDDTYTDVDMDMFVWIGDDISSLSDVLFSSADDGTDPQQEILFFPKVVSDQIGDAGLGLSFVYYSGTANPMTFDVVHADFADGALEPEAGIERKTASYSLANINEWNNQTTGKQPQIEQTLSLVAGAYTAVSDITVPSSSSRQASPQLPQLPTNLAKNKVKMQDAFLNHLSPSAGRLLHRK